MNKTDISLFSALSTRQIQKNTSPDDDKSSSAASPTVQSDTCPEEGTAL